MKFYELFICTVALVQDERGPRFCGRSNQVKNQGDLKFVCRPRNGHFKNPHLTKRCSIRCNGGVRVGPHKIFCDQKVGWIKRKDPHQLVDIDAIACV